MMELGQPPRHQCEEYISMFISKRQLKSNRNNTKRGNSTHTRTNQFESILLYIAITYLRFRGAAFINDLRLINARKVKTHLQIN